MTILKTPLKILQLAVFVLALMALTPPVNADNNPEWQNWSDDLFKRAKAENKLVILDLEAVWCHWCHVMEEKTYGDPKVKALLRKNFITVRVDQDANPDLSSRYGDWGWPATILFSPDGVELAKLSGYIPAPRMKALLDAFIKDPTPGPSVRGEAQVKPAKSIYLTPAQRAHLIGNFKAVYDSKNGGWGRVHKFIHSDSMDYALKAAEKGDAVAITKSRQTLDAALHLFDGEWGGVYQYSDKVDWKSPHYEKIMSFQAQYLRQYSFAYNLWSSDRYLKAATNIYGYLKNHMLSREGAFFTSQDADASKEVSGAAFYKLTRAERAQLGVKPRTDRNIYARENGWVISALIAYYNATGNQAVLDIAVTAANWIVNERSLVQDGVRQGGFRHGAKDRGGPYLGDSLAMGRAALDLYSATGDRKWLGVAVGAGKFITDKFKHPDVGFWTYVKTKNDAFGDPVRQIEENIELARFANLLYRTTGRSEFQRISHHAMRYLASPDITGQRRFLIGIVLADEELAVEPAHITVVGHKDDPKARALHRAARKYPALYKRVDWWDKREGPLANPDVRYPEMAEAAAFACANQICSLPVFEPGEIGPKVERMIKLRRPRISAQVK